MYVLEVNFVAVCAMSLCIYTDYFLNICVCTCMYTYNTACNYRALSFSERQLSNMTLSRTPF